MVLRMIIGILACIGFVAVFGGIVIIVAIFTNADEEWKEKHKQEEKDGDEGQVDLQPVRETTPGETGEERDLQR